MEAVINQMISDSIAMKLPELTERDIFIPEIKNKINVITGMRRTGKTYFLFQEMKKLLKGEMERNRMLYLNFEDERIREIETGQLHLITDIYFRNYPDARNGKTFLFFDEIQNIKGWEIYVRRILDTENVRICITGSSSKLLSREIGTSLRGRAYETNVYPFSFREILKHKQVAVPDNPDTVDKKLRSVLENVFLTYLEKGAFPEILGMDELERIGILQNYLNTVIFRDVVERYGITGIATLRYMLRRLLSSNAAKFSVNKFYNELKSQGLKCGKNSLHNYLEYFEDAFLIFSVFMKSASERQKMVNPRKIYCIDSELAGACLARNTIDTGRKLENIIFIELRRRNFQVEYVTTESGYEIDFYCQSLTGAEELIQVCSDIGSPETLKRELRAIEDVSHKFKGKKIKIITLNNEQNIKIGKLNVEIIPAWKFMLDRKQR